VSFTCNFALQRLALCTKGWFLVVTAGLAGNAVTSSLPGGSAAGAAVQFRMLTTAGFDTDTDVGGLTAFSLLEVGGLLALPLFALAARLAEVPVSRGSSIPPCSASPRSSGGARGCARGRRYSWPSTAGSRRLRRPASGDEQCSVSTPRLRARSPMASSPAGPVW
jgi:hypothetical protein